MERYSCIHRLVNEVSFVKNSLQALRKSTRFCEYSFQIYYLGNASSLTLARLGLKGLNIADSQIRHPLPKLDQGNQHLPGKLSSLTIQSLRDTEFCWAFGDIISIPSDFIDNKKKQINKQKNKQNKTKSKKAQ